MASGNDEDAETRGNDRRFGSGSAPVRYPDPDVVSITPAFDTYKLMNAGIIRLWTGALWAEGPAWSPGGNYLVWSDIPNDVHMRWLAEDDHVSIFRHPSGNSAGNAFDREGRLISCEQGNRRMVRYEHDGSVTVLADMFNGKPLNSPNDVAVHRDGTIWFTDPPFGTGPAGGYEGTTGELHHPNSVYRIDPSGRLDLIADDIAEPNGIGFSPDYKRIYIVDTADGINDIKVYDVVDSARIVNGRQFTDILIDGRHVAPDGFAVDIDGNIWAAGGQTGDGFDGVHCFTPEGERIGFVRLPETVSNLTFGGPKHNRLMIAASQSIYALYVNTRGATY